MVIVYDRTGPRGYESASHNTTNPGRDARMGVLGHQISRFLIPRRSGLVATRAPSATNQPRSRRQNGRARPPDIKVLDTPSTGPRGYERPCRNPANPGRDARTGGLDHQMSRFLIPSRPGLVVTRALVGTQLTSVETPEWAGSTIRDKGSRYSVKSQKQHGAESRDLMNQRTSGG
jgi:hypothetical protein